MYRTRFTRAQDQFDAPLKWLSDMVANRKRVDHRQLWVIRATEQFYYVSNGEMMFVLSAQAMLPKLIQSACQSLQWQHHDVYSLEDGMVLPAIDPRQESIWRAFMDNMQELPGKKVEVMPVPWVYHVTQKPTDNAADDEFGLAPVLFVGKPGENRAPVFAMVDHHNAYPFLGTRDSHIVSDGFRFFISAESHLGITPVMVTTTTGQRLLPCRMPREQSPLFTTPLTAKIQTVDITKRSAGALTAENVDILLAIGDAVWAKRSPLALRSS